MKRYVVLDKKRGETPLMALSAWKSQHPAYAHVPAAYMGRLDPMASGKLLVLLGEECKRAEHYRNLDKEYEIEVLLDVGSDTGDALGMVDYSGKETQVSSRVVTTALMREIGAHMRPYPAFSSKTVNGKPLFLHALEGTFPYMEIPTHKESIYKISMFETKRVTAAELATYVTRFLALVPKDDAPSKVLGADFRIDAVRASWKEVFEEVGERSFSVLRLRVRCGTGTYMRSLAGRIGQALGTSALALSIHRTRIGRYRLGFWCKDYS